MTVIIHHANCPDGFGAAWWLGKHIPGHIKHAANWGDEPPLDLCAGEDIYIVDFCYPPDQLAAIAAAAKHVDVFDHHETSASWVQEYAAAHPKATLLCANAADYSYRMELDGGEHVNIVLDQEHSGVGIVAQIVHRSWGTMPPHFLANIEDRDLWRFQLPDTKDVFAAVTSRPYADEAWDEMVDIEEAYQRYADGGHSLSSEGEAINRYRDQLIDQVSASTFAITIGGYRVPCASSPYAIGSDVAGRLARASEHGIGAYCILHESDVQIGLRARSGGPNVATIAEFYGGGGHPAASGLRVDWDSWASIRA